ncbi:EAL domain-containing protein, partial [Aeromonas media]|uniref:EAL domain-containing protein n=1 Tax=Aeromonas media TaxID=651 RepID=UPI00223F7407
IKSRYQPIININNGREVGYEVLSTIEKCDDVEKYFSEMSDSDVINLVKNQINQINHICRVNFSSMRKRFFVNVRATSISDRSFIEWLCNNSQCKLALEVDYQDLSAQSIATFDPHNLELLRHHGHQIWLDDFNCNFGESSSLLVYSNYWDGIKIDKKVLWKFCHDTKGLKYGVDRCRCLSDFVLIEGVETAQHLRACEKVRIDYCQGFHWKNKQFV